MIGHIQLLCKLPSITTNSTVIYEDYSACISQIQEGYIKGDRIKHISPKFFYTHDLHKDGIIKVQRFNQKRIKPIY